jgi:Fe-S-cluster containining protein
MEDDLARLCQSCGLCCDGSLFGFVALEPREVEAARKKRLQVVKGGKGFEQPCAALEGVVGGCRTCRIYPERPLECRSFACRLYDRHRRDGGPLEPRLAAVRRVRELASYLEASGRTPTDFDGEQSAMPCVAEHGLARQAYFELRQRLEEDFARA